MTRFLTMRDEHGHRPIRSYLKRQGRLSARQKRGLTMLSRYAISSSDAPLDLGAYFTRNAPIVLEIGFGMGDSFLEMVRTNPTIDFIGMEVYPPGIGSVCAACVEEGLDNVRIGDFDAVSLIDRLADASIDRVQIYFPDPWHKARHHKRRLINQLFLQKCARVVRPGGQCHIATDWTLYKEAILEAVQGLASYWQPTDMLDDRIKLKARTQTKYEARGLRLDHPIWDIYLVRGKE
mgnify:CR=1 FL=1